MKCLHCGSTSQIIPLKDGRPSQVCHPCRKAQKKHLQGAYRSGRKPTATPRHARMSGKARPVENDRQVAIRRAQSVARKLGIPLSRALEKEGI